MGVSPAHDPHGTYQRIQAPADRAIAARSETAQVKRARFAFTLTPSESVACPATPATGRSP
jgi:hypothetical protein